MENFKSIGESANNVLQKLTSDKLDQLCNRHVAKLLYSLDYLDDNSKDLIRKEMRFLVLDIKNQVLGIYQEKYNGDQR